MFRNGAKTDMLILTAVMIRGIPLALQQALTACAVAVPGTCMKGVAVSRFGSTTTRGSRSPATSACVSPYGSFDDSLDAEPAM